MTPNNHASELLAAHETNATKISTLAAEALTMTQKLHCDAIKVSASCEYEARLVVENKVFTLANSLRSQSLHVEVYRQQKKGTASINILDREALDQALKQASTLADFSIPDPFLTLADHQTAPPAAPLAFLWDELIANVDLTELQAGMQAGLARLCADKRMAIDRFEASVSLSQHLIGTSLGVMQSETQSTIDWSYMGMGRDGEQVSGMDYDSGFSYQQKGWLDRCLADIDLFTTRVLRNLEIVPCPTYKGPVILSPRAVDDILLSIFGFHWSGRAVMDHKSRWQDQLGSKVLPTSITCIDAPHHAELSGSSSFDADGLPTNSKPLIENGVLKNFVHDLYSAKRCKTVSNAMAGGPFGLIVSGGKNTLAELQNARREILYVERFSGNSDPLTGQFSGVAKNSHVIRNGEYAGNVSEVMIAGNVFDAASSLLPSREVENIGGSSILPSILIDDISVTSK